MKYVVGRIKKFHHEDQHHERPELIGRCVHLPASKYEIWRWSDFHRGKAGYNYGGVMMGTELLVTHAVLLEDVIEV